MVGDGQTDRLTALLVKRMELGARGINHLSEAWKSDPYWVSWATKLDDTDFAYFLPEIYQTLAILTEKTYDYVPVWCGDICLYFVGVFCGDQPFGPFWHDSFTDKMHIVESRMARRLCAFAKCLQDDLDKTGLDKWVKSYLDSNSYLTEHRRIVRRVGQLLDVDMDNHDLSKSRIVQIALGFLWHWPGERENSDQISNTMELALDAVHAGHLEFENHHPEHATAGMGCVDVDKLFVDRLSVHLQKDPPDEQNGWGINLIFIPLQYRDEWTSFVESHGKVNLYQATDVVTV